MRIPSYLACNKYGQYHFRICFLPKSPLSSERLVFKKTLKTKDKEFAVLLARAIKVKIDNRNLFSSLTEMNWIETKAVLNKIVEDTLEEYRNTILDKGTYGDHITSYTGVSLERQAVDFIQKKSQSIPVKIQDYPLLKEYADQIMTRYALDVDLEKYDRNAIQIAEMLFKIRTRRYQVVGSFYRSIPELYREVQKQFAPICERNVLSTYENGESSTDVGKQSSSLHNRDDSIAFFQNNNALSNLTPIQKDIRELSGERRHLLKDLINEFVEYKIQKQMWKSPETIRLNKMKLGFIYNVLEYIKKTSEIFIDDFTKADAVTFEKVFQRLPANLTKFSKGKSLHTTITEVLTGDTPFGSTMSSVRRLQTAILWYNACIIWCNN